jgi:hypothetical protein
MKSELESGLSLISPKAGPKRDKRMCKKDSVRDKE